MSSPEKQTPERSEAVAHYSNLSLAVELFENLEALADSLLSSAMAAEVIIPCKSDLAPLARVTQEQAWQSQKRFQEMADEIKAKHDL